MFEFFNLPPLRRPADALKRSVPASGLNVTQGRIVEASFEARACAPVITVASLWDALENIKLKDEIS